MKHRWKGFESLGSQTSHHVALLALSPTPAAAKIISVMAGFDALKAALDIHIKTVQARGGPAKVLLYLMLLEVRRHISLLF